MTVVRGRTGTIVNIVRRVLISLADLHIIEAWIIGLALSKCPSMFGHKTKLCKNGKLT